MNQKTVKEINENYDKILKKISEIQDSTGKELWRQRNEIWQTLDKKLDDIK